MLRFRVGFLLQYDAGRLPDPARAGVRQPAGVRLQDGVHQPAGSPLRGENSEEVTAQVQQHVRGRSFCSSLLL